MAVGGSKHPGDQQFRKRPEYIAERREVIRKHHPDHGGSDQALIDALRQLDAKWERKHAFSSALREQLSEFSPSLLDEEKTEQALRIAEKYADPVVYRADGLVERGQRGSRWVAAKGQELYETKVPPKVKKTAEGAVAKAAQKIQNLRRPS